MTDIVEKLRGRKAFGLNGGMWMMLTIQDSDCQEAADEIERLRKELEYVRAEAREASLERRE